MAEKKQPLSSLKESQRFTQMVKDLDKAMGTEVARRIASKDVLGVDKRRWANWKQGKGTVEPSLVRRMKKLHYQLKPLRDIKVSSSVSDPKLLAGLIKTLLRQGPKSANITFNRKMNLIRAFLRLGIEPTGLDDAIYFKEGGVVA